MCYFKVLIGQSDSVMFHNNPFINVTDWDIDIGARSDRQDAISVLVRKRRLSSYQMS